MELIIAMAGTVLRLSSPRAPSELVRAFLAIGFEPFAIGKYGFQVVQLKLEQTFYNF